MNNNKKANIKKMTAEVEPEGDRLHRYTRPPILSAASRRRCRPRTRPSLNETDDFLRNQASEMIPGPGHGGTSDRRWGCGTQGGIAQGLPGLWLQADKQRSGSEKREAPRCVCAVGPS
jgi:hypothetical protein